MSGFSGIFCMKVFCMTQTALFFARYHMQLSTVPKFLSKAHDLRPGSSNWIKLSCVWNQSPHHSFVMTCPRLVRHRFSKSPSNRKFGKKHRPFNSCGRCQVFGALITGKEFADRFYPKPSLFMIFCVQNGTRFHSSWCESTKEQGYVLQHITKGDHESWSAPH